MVDVFLHYLQNEKRYSPHTLTSYKNDLNAFAEYLRAVYSVEEVHTANFPMIRSWMADLSDKDMSPKTIHRKMASLRSFFHYCRKKDFISSDPTLKIKTPKLPKRLPVFVEEQSMIKLLDQVVFEENFEGKRDQMVLELLYGTGIRLSELIGLKESDIQISKQTIKVTGKGNKQRIIPLNSTVIQCIQSYSDFKKREGIGNTNSFFIVTNDGEQSYPMFIYRLVRKYLDQVTTVEKRSPHVLRHTFATHLLNKGADLNAIKDLLGHSSLAATQVYTHNTIDKLKAIFEQAHPKS